jgi:excisionase family DNA binding protein
MTTCPHCGHPCGDRSTYTVRGAAKALGVKVRRVQDLVRDGTLRALTSPSVGRATLIDGESVRAEVERRHTLT